MDNLVHLAKLCIDDGKGGNDGGKEDAASLIARKFRNHGNKQKAFEIIKGEILEIIQTRADAGQDIWPGVRTYWETENPGVILT